MVIPTAKKPLRPKSKLSPKDLRALEQEWQYLQSKLGGQKALAGALINPKTGNPVDARTLRKWWSGERSLPDYAQIQISQLTSKVKHEEKRARRREQRRRKIESIRKAIRIYTFEDWFSYLEEFLYRSYDNDELELVQEKLFGEMTGLNPESVLTFELNEPGWLSPKYGKHNISELVQSDLILVGIKVFVNDKYTRIYVETHRPPRPMWNYENKKYNRTEDLPKVFELIDEAWQNLASDPFGTPVLLAFARDPEQIE